MVRKIVALLGGDRRELELIPSLQSVGWEINSFALPAAYLPCGVHICSSVRQAVEDAGIIILPLPGIRSNGMLHAPLFGDVEMSEMDFAYVQNNVPIIVGVASAWLLDVANKFGIEVVETSELDAVARPNAIPTAEGAIQLTMENTPITIDGMKALVIGYGRVGSALAARLRALGANVTVVNRGAGKFAAAAKEGYGIYPWDSITEILPNMDVIYNTVPAMVLSRDKLLNIKRSSLIMDLASLPGGVDFVAARELDLKVIHALSLPGKVAPVSAGRVLASVYPRLLAELWTKNHPQDDTFLNEVAHQAALLLKKN